MSKIFNFQFSTFKKLKVLFRRPKVVIVTGRGRTYTKGAIFQILKPYFKVGDEVLILEGDFGVLKSQDIKFLIKNSSLPILVVNHFGEIPSSQDGFMEEKENIKEILNLVKILPPQGSLVLNFDDKTIQEIKNMINQKVLTFGFQEGADLQATDIKLNSGTNFKLNFQKNVVPIWLHSLFDKEHVYNALAAVGVGVLLDLNLIEISQELKNYKFLRRNQAIK